MQPEQIDRITGGLKGTGAKAGRILYDRVLAEAPGKVLELGCYHGCSTLYIAAALETLGKGTVRTMDLEKVRALEPNIFELARRAGLEPRIEIDLDRTSYNWRLGRLIEEQTADGICRPLYDFCFLDAGHTWEVSGFGFFLIEKLLKPGGVILMDDLNWTIEGSAGIRKQDGWLKLSADEIRTPQVGKIFDLIVRQHPGFEEIDVINDGNWGIARKKQSALPVPQSGEIYESL